MIRTLVIDRPDKKNAITAAMYTSLAADLNAARQDDAVGAVLITGAGSTFTAGNDLRDFLEHPPGGEDAPVFRFLFALAEFDKPLVAAVRGPAIGIGTTMLLHCDFVFVSPSARFQMPFIDLGLVPEAASTLLLPSLVGMRRAAQWLMLGEPFNAEIAVSVGLANEIVPDDALLGHAQAIAERLAAKPRQAMRLTKRLLRHDRADVLAAIRREAELFREALQSNEARAAFQAFLTSQKSTPSSRPQ
ncbi:MAG TPA: enoyl-CoA hydratase [Gemmatimonadaceae bacterium]|nr:enoyl-CoA hydratase [Gemmatimonadaceae bacterium]